jgi:hypothetical protein
MCLMVFSSSTLTHTLSFNVNGPVVSTVTHAESAFVLDSRELSESLDERYVCFTPPKIGKDDGSEL